MRIAICGSVNLAKEMKNVESVLKDLGHEVVMPASVIEYSLNNSEAAQRMKSKDDYLKKIKPKYTIRHFNEIRDSDAIIVVNGTKNGIENYIGGATFSEIMLAFYFRKRIFFLNPIPIHEKFDYVREEIESVEPIILNGNVENIKNHL